MTKNTRGGFTLIELLVVVAIISILATIVLVSLGSARSRANDAKVVAQLASMRAQAELYALGHGGTYGPSTTNCDDATGTLFSPDDPNSLAALITGMPSGYSGTCYADTSEWYVLISGGAENYCVDNSGQVVSSSKPGSAGTLCYSRVSV